MLRLDKKIIFACITQHTCLLKLKKNPYTFFKNFCLRTPLFPLHFYTQLTDKKHITDPQFVNIWKNPALREAIFLASPELFSEIAKWMDGETTDPTTISRLKVSFLKYIARISSRCTPFGLFAGCSLGVFDKHTSIQIADNAHHGRQTRFDMNFLVALSQELSKKENIKAQLQWYPNNSLYRIGNQYRYVEYQYDHNNNREHSLEALQYTPYLEQLLVKAANGSTLDELATLLTDDEITKEEALEYIHLLVQNQILVSELEPAVTGDDFLEQINSIVNRLSYTEELQQHLRTFQNTLDQIDSVIGNSTTNYQRISGQIQQLEIPFQPKFLFQTDLYPTLHSNQLHVQWGYRLTRLMGLFSKMSPPPRESNMDRFISAFTKRYETREIPLTTALDTEIGIGYLQHQEASDSTPFLDDLDIPVKKSNEHRYQRTEAEKILNKKLQQLLPNTTKLDLTDWDFKDLEEHWEDLPDTMSAMTELVTIDNETRMVVSSIGGSSAANLLGRFTPGNQSILEYVQQITRIEQEIYPEVILAEIVHLPQSRTGNVIRRAKLRNYEIPYLGTSNLPKPQQISIDDILISVQYGKVRLRSKKLNKYILPRLSNAHNYSANALPIYHFLCDMQTQKLKTAIGFNWGPVLEQRFFLPRVHYGEFILQKARWTIITEDVANIMNGKPEEIIQKVTAWRNEIHMPQYVQLVDGDNTLVINLANQNCIAMLWDTVKKRNSFVLEEFLFSEECIVQDDQHQGFTNQMVISFYNTSKVQGSEV